MTEGEGAEVGEGEARGEGEGVAGRVKEEGEGRKKVGAGREGHGCHWGRRYCQNR